MKYEDVIFEQRIAYLRRLLMIYVRFLRYYSEVEITIKDKTIEVKYTGVRNGGYQFQCIEFPKEHLGKRVAHYRAKVRAMFKNRHGNPNWK